MEKNEKGTIKFKETILAYLEGRAANDPLFYDTYHKEGKNIDDCITCILNSVKKSECSGFTDDEIYSMAVHYYDEDEIEIGSSLSMQVVVNHKIELTEEEKVEAKEKAIRELINETKTKAKTPVAKSTHVKNDQELQNIISGDMSKTNSTGAQQTLF